MKKIISILFLVFLLSTGIIYAATLPCTEEELLAFSDFAIEGYVVHIEHIDFKRGDCIKEYNGEQRIHWESEVYAESIATIKVTKNLKGDFNIGDKVEFPFLALIGCKKGEYILMWEPGPGARNIPLYAKIRYYHNTGCWNDLEIIGKLLPTEEIEEPIVQKEVDELDKIYYLIFFGILFFILILTIIFYKKNKFKHKK